MRRYRVVIHAVAERRTIGEGMTDDGVPLVPASPDFADFYRREYAGVVALTAALTRNRAVAEDVAQEAFLRAHRKWPEVSGYARPGSWVRTVAANLAVSRFRRLAAEARAIMRLGAPRTLEITAEDAAFWKEVRSLPARQAQVLALYYVEDRAVGDIARILDLSEGTVKTHLHRGRRTLAARLGLDVEAGA